MSAAGVSYRRPLNNEQLEVLKLLYRYRFATVEYVSKYLDKNNVKVVQKKLKVLEDQQFIAKHYDKTYKLAGRPAEYYLTPKGARVLRTKEDPEAPAADRVTEAGIKILYKNSIVSKDFMGHCLKILKVGLHFRRLYADKMAVCPRMRTLHMNYLPAWRPDLYLFLRSGELRRFFLDIWDGTKPFFVSVRKARNYISYFEGDDWPIDKIERPFILILCADQKNETKLRRQIRKALEEEYVETGYATTTIDKFLAGNQTNDRIWHSVSEYSDEEKKYSLVSLYKSLD